MDVAVAVAAIENIDVIVDGLDKGNFGRPLIALLIHSCHKTLVHAVLVRVDDASVRYHAPTLSRDGAAFEAAVQGSMVVIVVVVIEWLRDSATEFAVDDCEFASRFLEGSDFGIRKPNAARFRSRSAFIGCDVHHLIESNRLLCVRWYS